MGTNELSVRSSLFPDKFSNVFKERWACDDDGFFRNTSFYSFFDSCGDLVNSRLNFINVNERRILRNIVLHLGSVVPVIYRAKGVLAVRDL